MPPRASFPRSRFADMDRRDLLRFGFGGLVAGSLIDRRSAEAAPATAPRRLLLFYTPGGFFSESFQPDEMWSGDNAAKPMDVPLGSVTLGKIRMGKRQNVLDVLDDPKYASLKNELIVLDGVDMRAVERGDEHHNGIKAALRGRPIQTDDLGPFPNWSIDRVIAANMFPDGVRPVHMKNACLNLGLGLFGYQGTIRDAAEGGTALEPTSLGQMWDLLFKDFVPNTGGAAAPSGPNPALVDAYERRKILTGHTRAEIEALKRALGRDEQAALDRHLEAMNEITLQLDNGLKASLAGGGGGLTAGKLPGRPAAAYDPKKDLVAMCDEAANIIVQGLAFDRNRVAVVHTFGQNNNNSFWYPGASGAYHNGVCHGGRRGISGGQSMVVDAAMSAGKTLMKMYLDVLLKLRSIPEGSGTMLDTTTVATFSDMSHGDHAFKIPTLFVMGGGGGLGATGKRHWRTGRYVKFLDRGHTDYLLALAHGVGVTEVKGKPLVQIGSARYNKGPLAGLAA